MATATEPPPSPPSDHGDRDSGTPLGRDSVEKPERKKRVMSEKQLENLRKGREARAAKRVPKSEPEPEPTPEPESEPTQEPESEPTPEPESEPEPAPKPRRKLSEKQLEALRKARESKAAKTPPKEKRTRPPTMTTKRVETTVFEDLKVF